MQYRPQDVVEPLESIRNTVKFINWLILSRASPRGTLEPERSNGSVHSLLVQNVPKIKETFSLAPDREQSHAPGPSPRLRSFSVYVSLSTAGS